MIVISNKKFNKYVDYEQYIELNAPNEFNFEECLVYINRSELECMYKVKNNEIYKLLNLDSELILIKISCNNKIIRIDFINKVPSKLMRMQAAKHVWFLFDLDTNLSDFYKFSKDNEILSNLVERYYGLRIIKIDNIFEGLCWAIIGQQINLKFAYTLKKRFVEKYGESLNYNNENYWIFPKPEVIKELNTSDLRELQFTSRKAEYLIGLAKLFSEEEFIKELITNKKNYKNLFEKLISIRGVGKWTADYTILKCFNMNGAFPIADVGIHNALKILLKLDKKPSIEEIEELAINWRGWESYATFYLWRVLYE